MGVIIGSTTTLTFGSAGSHATQVSWNVNTNVQRAYVLGDWKPFTDAEVAAPTETLNITVYSPGPSHSVEPTEGCFNANSITASVSPAGCGAGADGPSSSSWYVTSYNYSKGDARQPGQESWSLMQYVTLGIGNVVLPTYNLRGISEGTITTSDGLDTTKSKVGVDMDTGTASVGSQGSVSAGQIGRSDNIYSGVVDRVGSATASSGDLMSGQCSMPYTPLYL